MKNKRSTIISLIINILIFSLTVFSCVAMFTGFRFMHGYEIILESTKLGMLRFFTVLSNIFMGITSLLFGIEELKVLNGKSKEIKPQKYILKLMATASVGLTFLVVFTYLGPIAKEGILSLLMNSNLFFHLIIPVLSIVNFIIFERTNKIKFKQTFICVLPTFLYEIYYLINVLIHMENGVVSPKYDWYWFLQNGVWTGIIVAPMILVITYILVIILWGLNKERKKR